MRLDHDDPTVLQFEYDYARAVTDAILVEEDALLLQRIRERWDRRRHPEKYIKRRRRQLQDRARATTKRHSK